MPRVYKPKKTTDYIAAAAIETENKPPFAPEVEQSVIGAMLVDENSIISALDYLSEKSFYDPKLRLVFRARIKRLWMDRGIRIAFVDYLQLMNGSSGTNQYRAQEIGEISRQLKETAKELHIPIIALAQLNRNLEARNGATNGRPVLSDLKDSGSIEQDADIVLFINRPGLMGLSENLDEAELCIAKNRAGELAIIPMYFNGDLTRFSEANAAPFSTTAAFDPFTWKD